MIPSVLQMVIDTSGSMNWLPGTKQIAPFDSGQSKWDITKRALEVAVSQLPASVALGINYFPNTPGDVPCIDNEATAPLPIDLLGPPSSAQRTAFTRGIEDIYPLGGTPTHAAYRYGEDALVKTQLPGQKFVLLITDGIPTFTLDCGGDGDLPVDNSPLIAEVARVRNDDGVKTFVVGSPGSEDARADLSRMASAGDTASPNCSDSGPNYCHLDLTGAANFSDALLSGLIRISGQVISCEYEIPPAPAGEVLDSSRVNVLYTQSTGKQSSILQDATGECSSGWQYDDPAAPSKVKLCGTDCAALRADPGGKIDLLFGCVTQTNIPK